MASDVGSNQSVERALTVLRVFTAGRSELRVSDVAKLADLGLSTASRLLATLEAAGFVDRDPVSGLYRLGLDTVRLGGAVLNSHPVHREARQIAQNLAADLGLGVNVAVRRDASLFYLLNFEGRQAPRAFVLAGQRNPLHATGLGKSLLTGLTPLERARAAAGRRPGGRTRPARSPPTSSSTPSSIAPRPAATARAGGAGARPRLRRRPDPRRRRHVVAALSVSGRSPRSTCRPGRSHCRRIVIEAADSISIGRLRVAPDRPTTSQRGVAVKDRTFAVPADPAGARAARRGRAVSARRVAVHAACSTRAWSCPAARSPAWTTSTAVLDRNFWPVLEHTVVFTVGSTVVPVVIGFAARPGAQHEAAWRAVLRGLFLMPWVIPGVVVSRSSGCGSSTRTTACSTACWSACTWSTSRSCGWAALGTAMTAIIVGEELGQLPVDHGDAPRRPADGTDGVARGGGVGRRGARSTGSGM